MTEPSWKDDVTYYKEEFCREDAACPQCGERNIDLLVWINDETVACYTCGNKYNPPTHPIPPDNK